MLDQQGGPRQAPLNYYPLWRYILIAIILAIAVIYALPNIFGDTPALQLSPKNGTQLSQASVDKAEKVLKESNIAYHGVEVGKYAMSMRFDDVPAQMKAKTVLSEVFGRRMTVALNLAPNTPEWLQAIGASPMSYGLDLRGGMYFVLEADLQRAIHNDLNSYVSEMRRSFREQDIRYAGMAIRNDSIRVDLGQLGDAKVEAAKNYVARNLPNLDISLDKPSVNKGQETKTIMVLALTPEAKQEMKENAMRQTVDVMRNRVNELGVAEASVTRSGSNRVVIELPGVQDSARAKQILGGTATVQFQLVNEQASVQAALNGNVPIGSGLYRFPDGRAVVLKNQVILSGKSISSAVATHDPQTQLPAVSVKLSGPEVSYFSKVTGENVGRKLASVLVQTNYEQKMVNGEKKMVPKVHKEIINVATIQSRLGNNFQITGLSSREAKDVALLIRSGSLPTPVQIVEEQTIGPTLGADNIQKGAISIVVALGLVILFMILYYGVFGLIANVALLLNLVLIVAVMSIIPGATLTLPGIAGIVLNLGMSIDGNVLIFERIREELRRGLTPQAAISAGYKRAFATIVDSNLTTLIVAIILFAIGTGSVKGFAVTLTIGIITSMFTAVTVSRAIVNLLYGRRRHLRHISIGIKPQEGK